MTRTASTVDRPRTWLLAVLLGLFFLSGASGLIYEIVWLRMLFRVFGSSAYATSNVLAIYMAGLALGAKIFGGRSKALKSPLLAYAVVELGLALCGFAATVVLLRLPEFVSRFSFSGYANTLPVLALRSGMSFAVLILPTALMGASLPLLTEFCSRVRRASDQALVDRPALLYGVNTVGAVAGVILPGFYLLGQVGETRTIATAVVLNLIVGIAAVWLALRPESSPADSVPQEYAAKKNKRQTPVGQPVAEELSRNISWIVAASGFGALALEVLWTRLLILLLGNSIYAFSAMLASFLVGVGVGSLLAARWMRTHKNLVQDFAVLQVLAGMAILATLEVYFRQGMAHFDSSFLYSPIHSGSDVFGLFMTAVCVVFPVTVIYGMLFPISVAIADAGQSGEAVGRIYTWNTLGSVAGSIACGFVLIPFLGTRNALYAIAALHVLLGFWTAASGKLKGTGGLFLIGGGLVVAAAIFRPNPFFEIVQNRLFKRSPGRVIFHQEGAASTVTLYAGSRGETLILINGIIVSGKGDLGRLMAHFPLILQSAPKKALVICLGAGNTFRAAVDHGVAVDLVELEPEVVSAFSALWSDHDEYMRNPRARVFINDGRNFLLTSRDRYDAIIVDGTPPIFSAGTVNLYSRQFVELAKEHLTSTGIFALWVPLPCFDSDFGSIARNFTTVFPHTLVWEQSGSSLGGVLLMGSQSMIPLDSNAVARRSVERRLNAQNPWLNGGLVRPGMIIDGARLRTSVGSYPLVTDDRPTTEFPLPLFLSGAPLRKTPESLFVRP